MTKITGLTALQARALRECFPQNIEDGRLIVTRTTAEFMLTPSQAAGLVGLKIRELPMRGHPRASLHAVRRKLERMAGGEPECSKCGCDLHDSGIGDWEDSTGTNLCSDGGTHFAGPAEAIAELVYP